MSKRTFALIFTLFIIAIVLVIIALYNPSSYDTSTPKTLTATPTPAITKPLAQTELKFGTLSNLPVISSSLGAKLAYSIPVIISSKNNKITAVQLELSYDPNMLTEISLMPGEFFPKPVSLLNQIDEKNGRISYAIGTSPTESGIQGEGVVAILTFQAKSPLRAETSISFLPKTLVTAECTNQTVLKSSLPVQIVIGENIDK